MATAPLTNPQILSGARGVVGYTDADGITHQLAIATDITINVRAAVRDTYVMGNLNAMSLDPTMIDCDCSIGRVVPMNQAGAAQSAGGLAPSVGGWQSNGQQSGTGAIELGLEQPVNTTTGAGGEELDGILFANSLQITLTDEITGKVVGAVQQARFSGRTLNLGSGDVATERMNFTGIYDSGFDGENSGVQTGYGV
jgi:hypothetical protein